MASYRVDVFHGHGDQPPVTVYVRSLDGHAPTQRRGFQVGEDPERWIGGAVMKMEAASGFAPQRLLVQPIWCSDPTSGAGGETRR